MPAVVARVDGDEAGLAFRGRCPDDAYLGLTLGMDFGQLFA